MIRKDLVDRRLRGNCWFGCLFCDCDCGSLPRYFSPAEPIAGHAIEDCMAWLCDVCGGAWVEATAPEIGPHGSYQLLAIEEVEL